MGDIVQLPRGVVQYLQLIQGLLDLQRDIDSCTPAIKLIDNRIGIYLDRIDQLMLADADENE